MLLYITAIIQKFTVFPYLSLIRTGSYWHPLCKHFCLLRAQGDFNGSGWFDECLKRGVLTPVPKAPSCLSPTPDFSFLTLYHAILWAITAAYPTSSEGEEAGGGQRCCHHSLLWYNQQKCWFGCRLWSQMRGLCKQTRRVSQHSRNVNV